MNNTQQILDELIHLLGGKCALCDKPYPDSRIWVIHHEGYKENEKDSKHFKIKYTHTLQRGKNKGKRSTKTIYFKLAYHRYLKPIVIQDPQRFKPLHHSCHQAVTKLARWQLSNLERLYQLAKTQRINQDLTKTLNNKKKKVKT